MWQQFEAQLMKFCDCNCKNVRNKFSKNTKKLICFTRRNRQTTNHIYLKFFRRPSEESNLREISLLILPIPCLCQAENFSNYPCACVRACVRARARARACVCVCVCWISEKAISSSRISDIFRISRKSKRKAYRKKIVILQQY